MVYKNLYIHIIARSILITANCIWLGLEFGKPQKNYTLLLIALILITQTILLIRHLKKHNDKIYEFLISFHEKGTSFKLKKNDNEKYGKLAKLISHTAKELKETRIKNEQQLQLIEFIIDNINTGLFAFNKEGKIIFKNKTCNHLFGFDLLNIERLKLGKTKILFETIHKEGPAGNFQLNIPLHQGTRYFLFNKSNFIYANQQITLITFQDVQKELDKKEIEAWQKLTQVLTHEIMNSITPITNLTFAMKRGLTENGQLKTPKKIKESDLQDLLTNISIIESRSQGLTKFVHNYKNISQQYKPELSSFPITNFFRHIIGLFHNEIKKQKIKVDCQIIPTNLYLKGDEKLLSQVLINIFKNAIEALKNTNNPKITLKAYKENHTYILKIKDNGNGIPTEKLDNIFVPFYTSKPKGSGIGLSLAKQIILAHKGHIEVRSEKKSGTSFKITL